MVEDGGWNRCIDCGFLCVAAVVAVTCEECSEGHDNPEELLHHKVLAHATSPAGAFQCRLCPCLCPSLQQLLHHRQHVHHICPLHVRCPDCRRVLPHTLLHEHRQFHQLPPQSAAHCNACPLSSLSPAAARPVCRSCGHTGLGSEDEVAAHQYYAHALPSSSYPCSLCPAAAAAAAFPSIEAWAQHRTTAHGVCLVHVACRRGCGQLQPVDNGPRGGHTDCLPPSLERPPLPAAAADSVCCKCAQAFPATGFALCRLCGGRYWQPSPLDLAQHLESEHGRVVVGSLQCPAPACGHSSGLRDMRQRQHASSAHGFCPSHAIFTPHGSPCNAGGERRAAAHVCSAAAAEESPCPPRCTRRSATSGQLLKCAKCAVRLTSQPEKLAHVFEMHDSVFALGRSFPCMMCPRKLSTPSALLLHYVGFHSSYHALHPDTGAIVQCTEEPPVGSSQTCAACGRLFRAPAAAAAVRCEGCDQPFLLEEELLIHQSVDRCGHVPPGPLTCRTCSTLFDHAQSLKLHLEQNHGFCTKHSVSNGQIVSQAPPAAAATVHAKVTPAARPAAVDDSGGDRRVRCREGCELVLDPQHVCVSCGMEFTAAVEREWHRTLCRRGRRRRTPVAAAGERWTCDQPGCGRGPLPIARLVKHLRRRHGRCPVHIVCPICRAAVLPSPVLLRVHVTRHLLRHPLLAHIRTALQTPPRHTQPTPTHQGASSPAGCAGGGTRAAGGGGDGEVHQVDGKTWKELLVEAMLAD